MRYHIDTIPVWDAVRLNGDCPLCALRRKVERTDAERFLGGSVMEPDTRIRVNALGFCPRHQVMLYAQKNRLGHALMMHTRSLEAAKLLAPALDAAQQAAQRNADTPAVKRLLGRGKGGQGLHEAAEAIRRTAGTCILCESVEENTRRYAYTLLHLYKTDAAFRAAFTASKGVCLPDLALLLDMAEEALSSDTLRDFVREICEMTRRTMRKNADDLEGFTLKFDYRNVNKPWGDSKGSLERTVNQLHGWCLGEEPNPE